MPLTLSEIEGDLKTLKKALAKLGMPSNLVRAVETRALRSGRRQTGLYQSNRQSRWRLHVDDPQYGSEDDCKLILLKLLLQLLQFDDAPTADEDVNNVALKYFGYLLAPGSYRDPLTLERLSYKDILAEADDPKHGLSQFHLGHLNPKLQPRHTRDNVNWRSARSNLIQGDLTLREARTKFVELIARYFDLGEVKIEPDQP